MLERRLAAIMFTDIVGYTALMGSDEDLAFEVLRKNREIHTNLIEKFKGTLIKEMGDGMLVSFNLASDAAQSAIEIQKRARKELKGQIRIGIHLGDITFENEDVFGDGVNIASRLQSITDPGGIYISESVHNAIRSRKDITSHYLGEFKLKNVNYPFKTYYIVEKGLPAPSKNRINELTGSERPNSIVVLPFDNYTGSNELEYFVAGMHSSLIGDMGKISALRVISKTTSNTYKDTKKSIPEIASELGVNSVIEASVLSLGDSVCLQVKLVNAYPEEKQLWLQHYYEEKSQILNLYNKVTKQISEEINIVLTPQEENLLAESRTVDPEAYDTYLKGRYYLEQITPDDLQKALENFNVSLDKDPDFVPAYAGIAEVWQIRMQMGIASPSIAIPNIYLNTNKALELDPNSASSHSVNAMVAFLTEWNWEKSEKEFLKVLEINPNHSWSRILYAHLLMCLRRTDEAYELGKQSLELDPLNPIVQLLFGAVVLDRGDYKEVLSLTKEQLNNPAAISLIEASYYAQGDYQNSFEALVQYLQFYLLDNETMVDIQKTYEKEGYKTALENAVTALEEKAKNSFVLPSDLIIVYRSELNKPEKHLELLEKAFETRDPGIPYISTNIYAINYLRDNPRFIELLKKMNLPVD